MGQTIASPAANAAVKGATIMFAAGLAFAGLNVSIQWATMVAGASGPAVAFWQYLIALALAAPMVARDWRTMRTNHFGLHLLRVLFAAAGVQVWVSSLSVVPIWQAIALSMTSPFFVVAGAALFLGERVTATRLVATIAGFTGA
ncbi:EamA family transporter, partial [Salmonella enterica subsp. enterica]|nr:EamA family transporter [Salmonella enterica subsp. enterica serovar Enteritidis]